MKTSPRKFPSKRQKLCIPILAYVLSAFLLIPAARADYLVTGPMSGEECTLGFICHSRHIDASMGTDKQLHVVSDRFANVSEFDPEQGTPQKGRCHIKMASGMMGMIAGLVSDQAELYEKQADGKYQKVDVEYVSFPCTKQ
jgi:hypothetical protein